MTNILGSYSTSVMGKMTFPSTNINSTKEEIHEKRIVADLLFERQKSIEYQKASIEFSKIIVAQLVSLNGGALIAIPTTFYYIKQNVAPSADVWKSLLVTAPPASGLLFGIVLGVLCGFFSYKNYQHHARVASHEAGHRDSLSKAIFAPEWSYVEADMNYHKAQSNYWSAKVNSSNLLGQITGWASICFFIASICSYVSLLALAL